MEVIISSSREFSLVEALKESSVSFFCSSRELDDEVLPENLPPVEKDADSSESDQSPADPPVSRAAPRVRVQAPALPSVPAPGGSTGSGGKRN